MLHIFHRWTTRHAYWSRDRRGRCVWKREQFCEVCGKERVH